MVEAQLYGEGLVVPIGVALEILKIAQKIISFSHIEKPISAGYQCIVTPLHSINCFNVSMKSKGLGTAARWAGMVHIPNSEPESRGPDSIPGVILY